MGGRLLPSTQGQVALTSDCHRAVVVSHAFLSQKEMRPGGAPCLAHGLLVPSPGPGSRSSARCPGGGRESERPLPGSTKVELVWAHLGSASLSGVGGSPVKMGLRRAVLHPQYNPSILDFDVAVLELARPLVFNKYVQPVCLPLAIQKFPVGRKCVISGWGNTQEGNGEPPPPTPARGSGPTARKPLTSPLTHGRKLRPAHGPSAAAFYK